MKTIVNEGKRPGQASRRVLESRNNARALQIKTILVPLDFSRASIQALKYAIPLAKEFEATIHLVHVQPADELTALSDAGGLLLNCTDALALMQDRLREALRDQGRFYADNCHVVSGRPFAEICELARKIKADLIVLPTRGLGRLKHVLLGSTAERIVRYAPCPVLIPHGAGFKSITWNGGSGTTGFKLSRILVPVDFSRCSLAAVNYAARLAKDTGAALRLFHVVFPYAQTFTIDRAAAVSSLVKNARTAARQKVSDLIGMDFLRGVSCEAEIQTGSTIDEICRASGRPEIDLVVTSTHGSTGLTRTLIGSVAEHVVRYAECPVIIVPSGERS